MASEKGDNFNFFILREKGDSLSQNCFLKCTLYLLGGPHGV